MKGKQSEEGRVKYVGDRKEGFDIVYTGRRRAVLGAERPKEWRFDRNGYWKSLSDKWRMHARIMQVHGVNVRCGSLLILKAK
jgi:hypothetical protein